MARFVGLDVSQKLTVLCVVDETVGQQRVSALISITPR